MDSTNQAPALWRVFSYSGPGLPRPAINAMRGAVIDNNYSLGSSADCLVASGGGGASGASVSAATSSMAMRGK